MNNALIQNECRRKIRLMGSAFEFIIVDENGDGEISFDEFKVMMAKLLA